MSMYVGDYYNGPDDESNDCSCEQNKDANSQTDKDNEDDFYPDRDEYPSSVNKLKNKYPEYSKNSCNAGNGSTGLSFPVSSLIILFFHIKQYN